MAAPDGLIQSAAGAPSGEPAIDNLDVNPPTSGTVSAGGDLFDQIMQQLAEAMRQNPQLALQIADLIDKGGSQQMDGMMGGAPGGGMPGGGAPTATPAQSVAPGTGISQFGSPQGGQGPISMDQIPPELRAQMDMLQKSQADQQVDRELSRLGEAHGKMRGHFGDVLPEQYDQNALLQKVADVMSGKVNPFDVAHALLVLETATGGEGNLRDRILAGAAQAKGGKPAAAPQEGRGGGIATGEETKQKVTGVGGLQKAARQLWQNLQQQAGT